MPARRAKSPVDELSFRWNVEPMLKEVKKLRARFRSSLGVDPQGTNAIPSGAASIDKLTAWARERLDMSKGFLAGWVNVQKDGVGINPHDHLPNFAETIICYLDPGGNSPPIVFPDYELEIVPKAGMALRFPADTVHTVSEVRGKARVVIAYHVCIDPISEKYNL